LSSSQLEREGQANLTIEKDERTMATTVTPGTSGVTSTTGANLGTNFRTALKSADSTVAQRLQSLSLVHQARLAQLTRAAASTTAQYGKGSPQATAAEAAVTASKATIAQVEMAKLQNGTSAPQVAKSGWALYGHVFNSNQQPVTGYTLFLVDAQSTYQQAYGFSYTDNTGYFQITFAGTTSTQGQASQKQESAPATQSTSPAPVQLFVEVANPKSEPIYLSKTPFQPNLRAATYQNVILPAGEKPIGNPPEAIRAVALPPATKKT
jgi:hypothetical protein